MAFGLCMTNNMRVALPILGIRSRDDALGYTHATCAKYQTEKFFQKHLQTSILLIQT